MCSRDFLYRSGASRGHFVTLMRACRSRTRCCSSFCLRVISKLVHVRTHNDSHMRCSAHWPWKSQIILFVVVFPFAQAVPLIIWLYSFASGPAWSAASSTSI